MATGDPSSAILGRDLEVEDLVHGEDGPEDGVVALLGDEVEWRLYGGALRLLGVALLVDAFDHTLHAGLKRDLQCVIRKKREAYTYGKPNTQVALQQLPRHLLLGDVHLCAQGIAS